MTQFIGLSNEKVYVALRVTKAGELISSDVFKNEDVPENIPGFVEGMIPSEAIHLKTPAPITFTNPEFGLVNFYQVVTVVMSALPGKPDLPLTISRMIKAGGGIYLFTAGSPISPELRILDVTVVDAE